MCPALSTQRSDRWPYLSAGSWQITGTPSAVTPTSGSIPSREAPTSIHWRSDAVERCILYTFPVADEVR
jgi:hypothetical protein